MEIIEIVKKGIADKSTFAEVIASLKADGAFDVELDLAGVYPYDDKEFSHRQNYYETLDDAILSIFDEEKLENDALLDTVIDGDEDATVDRITRGERDIWHVNLGIGGDNGLYTTLTDALKADDWWEDRPVVERDFDKY